MKKIAVILSGCGYLDGAEIREAVLTLLYLDQAKAEVKIFAPDINQHHVINHLNGEETSETRNVLVESARIARGDISPLEELNANNFFKALESDIAFKSEKLLEIIDKDAVKKIVDIIEK